MVLNFHLRIVSGLLGENDGGVDVGSLTEPELGLFVTWSQCYSRIHKRQYNRLGDQNQIIDIVDTKI